MITGDDPSKQQDILKSQNIQESLNSPLLNSNQNNSNNANNNVNNENDNLNEEKPISNNNNNSNISYFLINYVKKEKDKKLNELLSDLIHFKEEKKVLKEKIDALKDTLFENLEKNLIELSFIPNRELRKERLLKLYFWYKKKKETFEDLQKISSKSYKEKDEIDDLDVLNEKEEEKKLNVEEEDILVKINKTLEDFYKHRNKEMLFKDMLEDYKRKNVSNPFEENVENNFQKELANKINEEMTPEEKAMYKTLSMKSFKSPSNNGEISTFYSTRNGQNSFTLNRNLMKTHSIFDKVEGGAGQKTFYSAFNKTSSAFFPPLNRETKFSYSYNRPDYNYYSMYAENKIIQNKMKNLSEKRSAEEIDNKVDIYGYHRSKLKESIINKYEIRDIINMYANTNDFNSPLLEKYKFNTTKNKKEKENIFTKGQSKLSSLKSDVISKKIEFEKKEKIVDFRNMKRSQSCAVMNYNTLTEKKKMEMNNVKNLDFNSKSILEKNKEDIKTIKMRLKQTKEKINSKLLNFQENTANIPYDVIPNLVYKNSLFKEKLLFNNICKANFKKEGKIKDPTDTGEDSESEYHNFYMSAYDFGNLKKLENYRKINTKTNFYINRNKNKKKINENINKTFNLNRNNYLNFRKTMSSWKKNDFEILCKKIIPNKEVITTKKNINNEENKGMIYRRNASVKYLKQNSLLNAMVNPIEIYSYPQYFLPRSGSMLLKRKEQGTKKGKKNKKK